MFTEGDYKKVFDKVGFAELSSIKKDVQKGYYISHGKIAKKEVVIRILTKNDKLRVKNYKKELSIFKILETGIPKEILSRFACTWDLGEDDKFVWSVRDYVSGKVASLYEPSKMLMGYDEIDPKIIQDEDLIISGVKENLKFLWSIDSPLDTDLFQERFNREVDPKTIKSIESGIGFSLSRQIDFYEQHKDQVFLPQNIKASFGDLIPANIIYSKNKKVFFLDFEWFSFDHYLADVSFLWLYLWRYPAWQKKLLDLLIVSEDDKVSFRINLIRQIIGFYSEYIFNDNEAPSKSVKEKREFFPKHIWTEYLIASGESYGAIMQVKK